MIANLAFIVCTLGRVIPLRKLLHTLEGEIGERDLVIVVAQGNFEEIAKLIAEFNQLPIKLIRSGRGLSLGRNRAIQMIGHSDFYLLFPNDTSWYPAGMVSSIRACLIKSQPSFAALGVKNALQFRSRIPERSVDLDRGNLWGIVEPGLVIKSSALLECGGFDERLGTGANTPWQSGEGSDLILRLLDVFGSKGFIWFPRQIFVCGITEAEGLTKEKRRQKLRAYGRGFCFVGRLHGYSYLWCVRHMASGLSIGVRQHDCYDPLDGVWCFLGRLEGTLGWTFGKTRLLAAYK